MGQATPNKSSFSEGGGRVENSRTCCLKQKYFCMYKNNVYFSFYNFIFCFSRSSVKDNPNII